VAGCKYTMLSLPCVRSTERRQVLGKELISWRRYAQWISQESSSILQPLRSIRCSGTKYVSTFCDRRQGCGSIRPIAAERNEETIGWASVLIPNLVL